MIRMMVRFLVGATILAAAVAGYAGESLSAYLKLRREHGVTQHAGVAALETLVGTRVLEVSAVCNGVIRGPESSLLLVRASDGGQLHISSVAPPEWLLSGEPTARLLVRASRAAENAPLRVELLAALSETTLRRHEDDERKKLAAARPATKTSRSAPAPLRGTVPASNWQVSPREAVPLYQAAIQRINPRLPKREAERIATGVVGFSVQYGVDARLVMAMIMVESGFNPQATSPKGAMGLGQLMPGTAKGMGVRNPYDSIDNLGGAIRLIRGHMEEYHTQSSSSFEALVLALAAYNAGGGAVRKHGGVPPYKETQNYVRKVIALYRQFAGG